VSDTVQHHEERIGILLSNLGTPDAPTTAAVRRYLAEFLSDQRVIEIPRWKWWPILHGIILRLRPKRVAAAYEKIWTDEGSPLLTTTLRQGHALQQLLDQQPGTPMRVVIGMRYGNPSIASALLQLRDWGATRLLVLPLYPQYSATTTASTFDAVTNELQQWRRVPELRFINDYHGHLGYITALANSIRNHYQQHGTPERLLFSFHGLPERYRTAGDPYYDQALETARQVSSELGLNDEQWQVAFQSRFGREQWLQPYTDETLRSWGRSGLKRVAVICPGFAADCLETVEEIAVENRSYFLDAGGKQLDYIPALNNSPKHIEALTELIKQHSQGWR